MKGEKYHLKPKELAKGFVETQKQLILKSSRVFFSFFEAGTHLGKTWVPHWAPQVSVQLILHIRSMKEL